MCACLGVSSFCFYFYVLCVALHNDVYKSMSACTFVAAFNKLYCIVSYYINTDVALTSLRGPQMNVCVCLGISSFWVFLIFAIEYVS